MKNSKFVLDKIAKLVEQGLISSKDIVNELMTILKSKRDEFVFKMKLTSKDEFEILSKRVENLEKWWERDWLRNRRNRGFPFSLRIPGT